MGTVLTKILCDSRVREDAQRVEGLLRESAVAGTPWLSEDE